jgi:hypothetical protein
MTSDLTRKELQQTEVAIRIEQQVDEFSSTQQQSRRTSVSGVSQTLPALCEGPAKAAPAAKGARNGAGPKRKRKEAA